MFKYFECEENAGSHEIGRSEGPGVGGCGVLVVDEAIYSIVAEQPAQQTIAASNVNDVL